MDYGSRVVLPCYHAIKDNKLQSTNFSYLIFIYITTAFSFCVILPSILRESLEDQQLRNPCVLISGIPVINLMQ